ncbi:hypothetical protein [Marinilactibacillus kalidii]|uniref:hypothetical protein n=1 Tax=Marinilactibacillus kalidii TaxID=2820274 RepID=UPI001ABEB44A|nr:hypothetical protein [Marinilactibacillus kalidii]
MDYKKIVGLLAVSGLMLAACGNDEESTDTGTEMSDEEATDTEESGDSAMDIIDDIDSDSLDYTSPIEMEIVGAQWTADGYVYAPVSGEAVITGSVSASEEDTEIIAYVIQDGKVIEKPAVEEGGFTYAVPTPDEDMTFEVGVSDDDSWQVGDEANTDELVRYETIIVSSTEAEPAAEE